MISSIRLLALDIDGTVLRSDGTLAPATRDAVRAAQAAGVTVALATSRRWGGAAPIAAALGLRGPLILYDGALILTYPERRPVARATLAPLVCQSLAAELVATGTAPIAQYGNARQEWLATTLEAAADVAAHPFLRDYPAQVHARPLATLCLGRERPLRLVAFAREDALLPVMRRLAHADVHAHLLPLGNYGTAEIAVTRRGITKGTALARVARLLGIPLAATMAIGDSANDLPMLRVAGVGVAMGQADEVVRRAARFVTASNDADGVARAIHRSCGVETPCFQAGDETPPARRQTVLS